MEIREKKRMKSWAKWLEEDEKHALEYGTEQLAKNRGVGNTDWIQCCNPNCGKWRTLSKSMDGKVRTFRGLTINTNKRVEGLFLCRAEGVVKFKNTFGAWSSVSRIATCLLFLMFKTYRRSSPTSRYGIAG